MSLPALPDWKSTSSVLHQVVSLVGPIHKAVLPHRNNYMHLPMGVNPTGLESQTLPEGGKIHVDLKAGSVTYLRSVGRRQSFDFTQHTQRSLSEALLTSLRDDDLGAALGASETGSLAEGLVEKLTAEGKAGASLSLEGLTHDRLLTVDAKTASDFADVVFSIFTALSRFRARLEGAMTPLIVWPEHFDLSTIWFPPSNPGMDGHGPHLSVGFSPFTPGQYEFPYLYAYAYPYPEPFDPPALPGPASWHEEGWRGGVVSYEEIAQQGEHEAFVEEISLELFRVLSGLLNT